MNNILFLTRYPNAQVYFAYFFMNEFNVLSFITSIQILTVKDIAQVYNTDYLSMKQLQVLDHDFEHFTQPIRSMVDMVYLRNFDLEEKRMEFIGLFGRKELFGT